MKKSFLCAIAGVMILAISSCGGQKNLVVPHSVSTVGVTTIEGLRLDRSQYDIIKTVTETASVTCEYKNNEIKITGGDGDFSYKFIFNDSKGWSLASFSGAAALGYFTNDYTASNADAPSAEEFARRVAMAKIINAVTDYNADGIVEPVTSTRVENLGKNKIMYTTTVRAKLITIKGK